MKNETRESWEVSGLKQSEKPQQGKWVLCSAQRDGRAGSTRIPRLSSHMKCEDQFR